MRRKRVGLRKLIQPYLKYEVEAAIAVFDDGNKTYLRMPFRFSETPAFYISLDRRETMTNFRVKGRYYIVDRLFDKAYLKIGRKRVVLVRKDKLIDTNIRESRRTANPL